MANHQATGKKAKRGPELAQRCRAAVLNAFDAFEKKGKLISEVLADEFEKNPLKFMELASKYCPRDIEATIEYTLTAAEVTDDELADIATAGGNRTSKSKGSKAKSTRIHH